VRESGKGTIQLENVDELVTAIWTRHEGRFAGAKTTPIGMEVADRLKVFEGFVRGLGG